MLEDISGSTDPRAFVDYHSQTVQVLKTRDVGRTIKWCHDNWVQELTERVPAP